VKRATRLGSLAVLFLATYSVAQSGAQEQATALCTGEYSKIETASNGTTRSRPLDRWRMYAMTDGHYVVEVQRLPLSEPFRVDERRVFTKTMEPTSADIDLHQGAKIHCDYESSEIACTMSGPDGTSISSQLQQQKPYVFAPALLPLADGPWLEQMMAVQANRTAGSVTAIPLITLLNDDNGKDEDKLSVQDSVQIECLGSETIDLLSQRVPAWKFRMRDPGASGPDHSDYSWTSRSGILLQGTSGNQTTIKLTAYEGPQL
jgi:hypothetical protein